MVSNPTKVVEVSRGRRRTVVGVVTSDRMEKTIVVAVERLVRHPKFGKYLRAWSQCTAHDEKREAHLGDRVELMETRPLSKTKRWRLVRVVGKTATAAKPAPAAEAAPKTDVPAEGSAKAATPP